MGHRQPFIQGEPVPSVTQVLEMKRKIFLEKWRGKYGNKECDRYSNAAMKFGRILHDAIDAGLKKKFFNIKRPVPKLTKRHEVMLDSFWQWQREARFTPIETELFVLSRRFRYGGTFDALGYFGDDKGTLFLMDWKTSSSIDWDYGMQLAAYATAYQEETGAFVDHGGILRLEKKPEKFPQVEPKTFNKLRAHHWESFLGLRTAYDHHKLGEKHDATRCPYCISE